MKKFQLYRDSLFFKHHLILNSTQYNVEDQLHHLFFSHPWYPTWSSQIIYNISVFKFFRNAPELHIHSLPVLWYCRRIRDSINKGYLYTSNLSLPLNIETGLSTQLLLDLFNCCVRTCIRILPEKSVCSNFLHLYQKNRHST